MQRASHPEERPVVAGWSTRFPGPQVSQLLDEEIELDGL